jgi:hypothetical protein
MYKEDDRLIRVEVLEDEQCQKIFTLYTKRFSESPACEEFDMPLDWCIRKIIEYPERFAQMVIEDKIIFPGKLLDRAFTGVP